MFLFVGLLVCLFDSLFDAALSTRKRTCHQTHIQGAQPSYMRARLSKDVA